MSDRRIQTDDPGDPRVSAAYREMADERTPGHIDHTVLNAARAAARPGWNKAVAWLRPAAWAATIGVCLAIVVEIALLPDQDPAEIYSAPQEFQQHPDPQRSKPADPREPAESPEASTDSAVPSVEKAAHRARRLPSGDMKSTAAIPAAAPAANRVSASATERHCDETETDDPGTWLECILRLEREGLLEAARLERELLAEAFPPPELP